MVADYFRTATILGALNVGPSWRRCKPASLPATASEGEDQAQGCVDGSELVEAQVTDRLT